MEHTIALIEKSHKGDKEARDMLVEENLGLVWSVVKRFSQRGYELEDLFQIGSIGLIKAIDKFDSSFEVKFSTYAVPMISGEIKRFLRDDGMIKVSRSLKENNWKIKQMSNTLCQEYGREATIEEIATALEMNMEEIVMALEANVEVESIYKKVYQGEDKDIYLLDKMMDESSSQNMYSINNGINGDGEKEKIVNKMLIASLMEELNGIEKEIIQMRYFEDKTQTEVAKNIGISQVQVSRMEKKILLKLRKIVKETT